jgi:predicted MPP superfamily phosphohydrolase
MRTTLGATIFIAIAILMDTYIFQAIKAVSLSASPKTRTIIYAVYWGLSALAIISFLIFLFTDHNFLGKKFRTYLFATAIGLFLAKMVAIVFFLVDDIRRIIQWVAGKIFYNNPEISDMTSDGISRSAFLSWLGLAAGGTLFGSLLYGFSNKYNYQVKRIKLAYDNLPAAFKGLKIVHISDIHSGSFTDKKAVLHGVEKIMKEKADLILFTGDIVNDRADEMEDYKDVFNQLKAPMGVYSTLGNHDYGDYVSWPDRDENHRAKERAEDRHLLTPLQQKNLDNLKNIHAGMGWNLLLDEYVSIKKGDDEIALLGVQNISGTGEQSLSHKRGRFHSYGSLAKAHAGTERYSFKILMSHDPSHWDGEIKPKYADIDLTLSGHTHGMQFGVEIPGFKWSPVQYMYKQWDGLYEDGKQKLYVNPGYGFIGYPGRVGILPEITVIELV